MPQSRIDYLKAAGFKSGVNWDTPSPGHVDIDITVHEDELPNEWGSSPEFKMNMHINCGGSE